MAQLPNLGKLYFSEPWTDLRAAKAAVGSRAVIRRDMNPVTGIGAPEKDLRERMAWFADAGRDCVLEIHMASARTGTPEQVLPWVKAVREALGAARSAR